MMRLLCDVMVDVSLCDDKCAFEWRAAPTFFLPHFCLLTCIFASLFPLSRSPASLAQVRHHSGAPVRGASHVECLRQPRGAAALQPLLGDRAHRRRVRLAVSNPQSVRAASGGPRHRHITAAFPSSVSVLPRDSGVALGENFQGE